jgi:hypothetical protein
MKTPAEFEVEVEGLIEPSASDASFAETEYYAFCTQCRESAVHEMSERAIASIPHKPDCLVSVLSTAYADALRECERIKTAASALLRMRSIPCMCDDSGKCTVCELQELLESDPTT